MRRKECASEYFVCLSIVMHTMCTGILTCMSLLMAFGSDLKTVFARSHPFQTIHILIALKLLEVYIFETFEFCIIKTFIFILFVTFGFEVAF